MAKRIVRRTTFLLFLIVFTQFGLIVLYPGAVQADHTAASTDTDVLNPSSNENPRTENSSSTDPEVLKKWFAYDQFDTPYEFNRKITQNAFRAGEKLVLRVSYLSFTAGYITARVKEEIVSNRKMYTLQAKARTTGMAKWVYTARDKITSYMDYAGLFSWGFDYDQNHDGEKDIDIVRYDQQNGLVVDNGKKGDTIPTYTQDVLSAVYFLRTKELTVGESYNFPVHIGDEFYRLILKVTAVENIATPQGWRDAYKLAPDLVSERKEQHARQYLKDGGSEVRMWVSKDRHKIPIKISIPASFGSVYGYLHEYKP